MEKKLLWKFIGWFAGIVVVSVLILGIVRIPAVLEQEKTKETVEFIQAQNITLADVEGVNLPPAPDPELADATIEGIDENKNGIRDDVELEIFKRYPNDPAIRAAMLQYAVALQMYLTEVFNSDTLIAVAQQEERASACLADQLSRDNIQTYFQDLQQKKGGIKKLLLNTEARRTRANKNTYLVRSFNSIEAPNCDIDPKSLYN